MKKLILILGALMQLASFGQQSAVLDLAFDPPIKNGQITKIVPLEDGKILVGGILTP